LILPNGNQYFLIKKKYMQKVLLFFIVSLASISVFCQPANDDCVNAVVLTPAAACTATSGSNVGVASTDFDNCAEIEKRNVWYKFIATSGNHVVQVTFGTMQQGIINAFSNGCGTLNPLNCGGFGQTGPVIQQILNGLTIGQEYLVAVSTPNQSEEGTFDICITTPSPPANDECTAAIALPVNPSNVPSVKTRGTTIFATESQTACIGSADDDVWYGFVATQSNHRIHLFYSVGTFSLQAFSGTCGSLVSIACTTPSGVYKTNLLNGLIPGQTYLIRIHSTGSAASDQGSFQIAITSAPQNDECAGAVVIVPAAAGNTVCSNFVEGNSDDATQSAVNCLGGAAPNDTWFSFIANQAVHTIKAFGLGITARRLQVFSGNCGSLVSLTCNLEILPLDSSILTVGNLIAGQTYFIRVYAGSLNGSFNLCITSPIFPPNDECANAIDLVPAADSTIDNTQGSTVNATLFALTGGCNPTFGFDVWYKFTATAAQHVAKIKKLTNNGTLTIEWWTGACGSMTSQSCLSTNVDSLFGMGNLAIGTTYYLRVYSSSQGLRDNFSIALFTPNSLVNDECSGAMVIVPSIDASCAEVDGSNTGATQSAIFGCDGNTPIKDVWFQFTASSSSHRIRLSRGTAEFLYFQLFTGTCSNLTSLGCSAQNSSAVIGTGVEQRFDGLTVGNTYFIRVYNANDKKTGTFDLCVKTVVIPANNECASATNLIVQPVILTGTFTFGSTVDATASAQATSCSNGQDDDVWYQFTASQATMQVVLQNGTLGQSRVVVYSGNCVSLVLVKCQTAAEARDNWVKLTGLVVGNTYFIRVYSASTTSLQGSFSIMVTSQFNPPVNDDCSGAITLIPSATYAPIPGTLVDASPSTNGICGFGIDVWYRFTATATAHNIITDGFANGVFVSLFSGSCTSLVAVSNSCGFAAKEVTGLTIGTLYFVKVTTNSTSNFPLSIFNIGVTEITPPANNECAGAVPLLVHNNASSSASEMFSSFLSTFSAAPGCGTITQPDIWFSFVAPAEPVSIEVTGLTNTENIQLFGGTCSALTNLVCNQDIGGANISNVLNAPALINGQTYFIRVSAINNTAALTFKIKIYKNLSVKINNSADSTCFGSNLVLNPSLEPPLFFVQTSFISGANPGQSFIPNWTIPTRGTSDFFSATNVIGSAVDIPQNLCFGSQSARNGKGYAGLYAYTSTSSYREYLQTQLAAPLQTGKKYVVSMYVSLADFSAVAIDNLGMAFRIGNTALLQNTPLNFTVQVVSADNVFLSNKKDWVNVAATFVADQPYTHLIIGNFKNNALTDTIMVNDTTQLLSGGTFAGCATTSLTAYYYIEDVLVSEVTGTSGLCTGALPLNLLSFSASRQNEAVLVQWKTANEINVDRFEVQRSENGIDFSTIGTVRAGRANYSLTDGKAFVNTTIVFYRLKSIDTDTRFTYSNIAKVSKQPDFVLTTYPNPVSDVLVVNGLTQNGTISLFNADGKLLRWQTVFGRTVAIDMSDYARGMYLLQYKTQGQVVTRKISKQ
jgi:Secretion system C-terminal sorting domain